MLIYSGRRRRPVAISEWGAAGVHTIRSSEIDKRSIGAQASSVAVRPGTWFIHISWTFFKASLGSLSREPSNSSGPFAATVR